MSIFASWGDAMTEASVGSGPHLAENGALRRRVADLETEVRRLEAALRGASSDAAATRDASAAEAERFRDFFDKAPIGKSMTAPDGRLLRVNRALANMLGYSVEELQARSWASITHPDDVLETREAVRALLAGEREIWDSEKRYLAKGGHLVSTHITSRLVRDEHGKPLHFVTHIIDITDHKESERKVESQLEELRRWQEVMLDREDRVQELKREVNELSRRLGEGARYPSQESDAGSEQAKPNE